MKFKNGSPLIAADAIPPVLHDLKVVRIVMLMVLKIRKINVLT